MVKCTKRKIPLEKITKKTSRATCFSKRNDGLYSKASQLCLLSGAQIVVLATPSSPSNVSFYSFGHSSVDSVLSAFLSGQRPAPAPVPSENKEMREDVGICFARKDLGLGYWWEDESLYRSKNPQDIKDSIESMSSLLKKLRSEKMDVVQKMSTNESEKMDVVSHHETQPLNQTLIESTSSPADCLKRNTEIIELPENDLTGFVVKEQILANNNNDLPAANLDVYDIDQFIESVLAGEIFMGDLILNHFAATIM